MTEMVDGSSAVAASRTKVLDDIEASRALAVGRVFRGGVLGGVGILTALGADILAHSGVSMGPSALVIVGGGVLAAGTGFTLIGRALPHLRRFGDRRGMQLFSAAGVLGASAVVRGLSSVLAGFVGWERLTFLAADVAALGMVVSAIALVVIFVAGVLFGWTEPDSLEDLD